MLHLKKALVITKNTSETEFKKIYDMIKDRYLDEKCYLPTYSIDSLLEELNQLQIEFSIKKMSGISVTYKGEEKKLFSLPEYGWDGGSSIDSTQWNLKTLDTNDFGGGPIASIVTHENEDYPGFALHYSSNNDLGEIHIFM